MFKQSIAGDRFSYRPKRIYELKPEVAQKFIQKGIAYQVKVEAVPSEYKVAETAESNPHKRGRKPKIRV